MVFELFKMLRIGLIILVLIMLLKMVGKCQFVDEDGNFKCFKEIDQINEEEFFKEDEILLDELLRLEIVNDLLEKILVNLNNNMLMVVDLFGFMSKVLE